MRYGEGMDPICPECRCGRLLHMKDEEFHEAVECENCDRWRTTPPPASTPKPGSFLCRLWDAQYRINNTFGLG